MDINIITTSLVIIVINAAFFLLYRSILRPARLPSVTPGRAAPISYWIPYYGHVGQLLFRGGAFLQSLRTRAGYNYRLKLHVLGNECIVLWRYWQLQAASHQSGIEVDTKSPLLKTLVNVFDFPTDLSNNDDSAPIEQVVVDDLQLSFHAKNKIVSRVCRCLEHAIPDFVSFMSSPIDQATWERGNVVRLDATKDSAQVNFFDMLHEFTTQTMLDAVFPSLESLNYPEVAGISEDIRTVLSALPLLAAGLPRWVPIPRLTSAHIARRRLLSAITTFFQAFDEASDRDKEVSSERTPEQETADVAVDDHPNTSDILNQKPWRRDHLSPEARASLTLAMLMTLISRVNNLVFWTLVNIYASRKDDAPSALSERLDTRISHENAAIGLVRADQPKSDFPGISEPVRVAIDASKLGPITGDDIASRRSLLEASYLESVRLYSRSVFVANVVRDTTLTSDPWGVPLVTKSRELEAEGATGRQPVVLHKGDVVLIPYSLHNLDPEEWHTPLEWNLNRHKNQAGSAEAESKVLREGLDATFCGSEDLVRQLTLAFAGGFVAVWDVELVDRLPLPKGDLNVVEPDSRSRVIIRRRPFA